METAARVLTMPLPHPGTRYILYGEWCAARHTVTYDALPDWFLAYDVYDTKEGRFFSRWVSSRARLVISRSPPRLPYATNCPNSFSPSSLRCSFS